MAYFGFGDPFNTVKWAVEIADDALATVEAITRDQERSTAVELYRQSDGSYGPNPPAVKQIE